VGWSLVALVVATAVWCGSWARPVEAAAPLPGLAAAYGFSEAAGATTVDASGNGNTATLLGGATRTAAGKFGNAISLNGNDGVVRIPDHPSWKVSGATAYTISLWIKVKEVTGDYKMAVGTGSWPAINFHIYKLGSAWVYGLRTNGFTCGGQTIELPYLATAEDVYHHIAMVVNTVDGRCDFYSDGMVVDTDEYVSGTTDFATGDEFNDLYLGGLSGAGQNLNADLDEVRVYTEALTPADIRADMNTPVDGSPPPDTTAPVISEVASTGITASSTTITWTTDEPADSRVEYGTTTEYGSSLALDTNLVTAHSYALTDLAPKTLYHYRVHSRDAVGNTAISADFTFTTPLPPPPPASAGSADPTLLPEATGQATPFTTPTVAGGESYLDPVSGVRIWRATSESYPCAENTGLRHHDYGDTNQISHEWGDGYQTIFLRTCGVYYLVDFKRGVGFTNWRPFAPDSQPDADLGFVFSNNPATPQLAYTLRFGTLHRYNTATNQIENTGNFPRADWGARGWLQNDLTDTWFVANSASLPGCKAWNSQTNESREKTIPGYDECHLENRGRYVELNTGGGGDSVWDLETDLVSPFNPPTGHIFHLASPSGFFTSVDVNSGGGRTPYYRLDPATGTGTLIYDNAKYGYDSSVFHHSGNWVHQNVPDEQQWFLISTYGSTVGAFLPRAIGFMRLDGSDIRFLAHSYNEVVEYWKIPRAMVAPNGKLVVFDSDFRGASEGDVYVIEVPLR
jgi:hypothetical protein